MSSSVPAFLAEEDSSSSSSSDPSRSIISDKSMFSTSSSLSGRTSPFCQSGSFICSSFSSWPFSDFSSSEGLHDKFE
uniref:Cellular myelocytomatosis n=1 Tax=Romanomermis culicivorax TaxID=13658 RepID=A0A915IPS2_ROMCU